MRNFTLVLVTVFFCVFLSNFGFAQQEKQLQPSVSNSVEQISKKAIKKIKLERDQKETKEDDKYDGPGQAALFNFNRIKNPITNEVPVEKMWQAVELTQQKKTFLLNTPNSVSSLAWVERGSNTDVTGPSNGNTRANNGKTSGRIDAIMVDSSDATHKTVWIGGRDGGLWKTTDITANPATWTSINDYFGNLSISAITQDPTNSNIMYFCTGESYLEGAAVRGNGVFKSTNHGVTWTQLSSTTAYYYCTRILCDYLGNVYLATRGNGLLRSKDGGTTWTDITPAGLSSNICDLEITSTAVNSRLHMVVGIFSTQAYRYTDIAATVSSTTGWVAPVTPFPSYAMRAEIGVSGNTLYAAPADATYNVPTIYKSTDGGANWVATAGQPTSGWASSQGWYALTVIINPSNPNECFVGGLDQNKTTDGGATWTRASFWVGTTGQYVHADQHKALWYDGGTKLIFGCDGGVHFSSDGGTTITDRNQGLRLKQFYSCAIHPDAVNSPNYLLAGAQDNGCHQLNGSGLTSSVEVTGGDGAYVAIDQNEPQYQFGSYVYSQYRRSVNGGATWSSVNYSSSNGQFINPYDYDNVGNNLYAGYSAGVYFRWLSAPTTTTAATVAVANFNGASVTAIGVSPYTANRVYFGTNAGRVVRADNANATPTTVNLSDPGMSGYVNSVQVGSSDLNLAATVTSYGVKHVWTSKDGGVTWSACDGNLPDIPVYWSFFNPNDNNRLYIATETGVWETALLNGANTVWNPHTSFPTVRTTMLRFRNSDNTLVASTYGRGLWTATICASATITTQPQSTTVCGGTPANFTVTAAGDATLAYQWQISTNGGASWTNITGATTNSYSFGAVAADNGKKIRCYVTNNCPSSDTSAAATLTMATGTVGGTISPTSINACVGTNSTTLILSGFTGNIIRWESSIDGGVTWLPISNTTSSLIINNLTQTTQYRAVLQSSGCVAANSSVATINFIAAGVGPIFISADNGTVLCAGSPTRLTAMNATSATAVMGNALTSANGYVIFNFRNNNAFPVTITGINSTVNALGTSKVAAYYNTTPLTGNPGVLTIANGWNQFGGATVNITASGIQPFMTGLSLTVPAGATYAMCVAATDATGTAGNFAYSNTLSVGTASAGGCDIVTNSTIGFAGGLVPTAPATAARYFVGSITFGGAATPLSNATVLWSPALGLSSTTTNPTAAAPSVTTTYSVVATNPSGCTSTASVNVFINQPPSITADPTNTSACSGTIASFTVGATGSGTNGVGVTYQWQESTDGGVTYNNLTNAGAYSGVNTATLSIVTATAMNNNFYRCVIAGICTPNATSGAGKLTVIASPILTLTPTTGCGGVPGINGLKLVATSGVAAPIITASFPSGAINLPIVDATATAIGPTTLHTLNVSGIPAGAVVSEVSVNLNLTHTYVADMSINLKAPNGKILNLDRNLTATGNTGANFVNTLISSSGSTLLKNGTQPFTGTFKADAINALTTGYPFSDPTGYVPTTTLYSDLFSTPNGAWTIAMADDGAGDFGTFNSWTLNIKYSVPLAGGASLNYVWSPATGLYLDPACTQPYVAGTSKDSVYAAPLVNTIYTVSGTNTSTGCVSNTATATVNYTPVAPTVTPTSVTMCLGNSAVPLAITSSLQPITQTFTSGTINLPIVDATATAIGPTVSSVINVSGIPAGAVISKIAVKMNITHTYIADMSINLQAPNGKMLNIDRNLTGTGNSGANFTNTVISSVGTLLLKNGSAPFTNTYQADAINALTNGYPFSDPVGFIPNTTLFSDLFGTANGAWTIAMADDGAGDFGTFKDWSIDITYGVAASGIWTPATGLYTDAAGTIPYTAGTSVNTVYAKPGATTNYSVTVANGTCGSAATQIPVIVNVPVAIISPQPVSTTICANGSASFTVKTTGSSPSHNWQVSTTGNINSWTNIVNNSIYSGANTATLTITTPPVSLSGNFYRDSIKSVAPCNGFDTSSSKVKLIVNAVPVVTISAAPYTKLFPGIPVPAPGTPGTTTITATTTTTVNTGGYQWYRNGTLINGATSNKYVVDIDHLGTYTVAVTDANGCNSSAISNAITISDSTSGRVFVYPNPNTGRFQVRYNSGASVNNLPRGINVFDARGKRVLTQSYSINAPYARMDVDLTNEGSGVYWLEVVDVNGNRLAMGRVEVLR